MKSTTVSIPKKDFTVIVKCWIDKNGNTYHTVKVISHDGYEVYKKEKVYGYGDAYKQTAFALMKEAEWIELDMHHIYRWERDNNYPIIWVVSYGTKKEMMENVNVYPSPKRTKNTGGEL